jgi:monoamine oxidase
MTDDAEDGSPPNSLAAPAPPRRPGRRTFLAGVAVAGAAGTAGTLSRAAGAAAVATGGSGGQWARTADVLIVGAGLSGLCAAREIVKRGHSALVLEARDRTGGRMVRQRVVEGGWVDLGGQWVGPTQRRIIALADELGVRRFESYHQGSSIFYWHGRRSTFDGSFPPFEGQPPQVPRAALLDAEQALDKLARLAALVPPQAPWRTPGARALDSQTFQTWLESNTRTPFARFVLTQQALIGGSGAFEPGDASLLHYLFANRQAPQAEAPETDLFYGAAGQIAQILTRQMAGSIVLGSPVTAISADRGGVTVTAGSRGYRGRAVIVAVPPFLAGQITCDPQLPMRRMQLTQRVPMGSLFKVLAVYASAWWRDQGLNGSATGDRPTLGFAADSSPPSGRPGILASFIAGARAVQLSTATQAQLRRAVLDDLAAYYGPRAAHPVELIVVEWPKDRWTGGAFTAFMQSGTWTGYGQALRAPAGLIEWAGTEVADRWSGYFDGAVRAGQDAADRTLRKL